MKKILFNTCFIFFQLAHSQSPTLWGMSRLGGTTSDGNIFKIKGNGSGFTTLHNFNSTDGTQPFGSLLQGNDGKLYGMTSGGGTQGAGVIFSIDTLGNYTKLFDFNLTDGYNPQGNLIQATNGKLYGAAMYGGTGTCGSGGATTQCGVIFCFDINTNTYSKIMDFTGTQGHFPCGSLLQASDGNLYGMTKFGGSNGNGNLFKINPSNNSFSNLHNFSNYANPTGNLIQATDGKLYGMTVMSGTGLGCGGTGCGTIFNFDITNNSYGKLYDFDTLGAEPLGSLIQANNGLFYGVTAGGGSYQYGVLFSFNSSDSSYTKLHDFSPYTGQVPKGSLFQASDNNLYGMTTAGCGGPVYGVLFSYNISSNTYSVIHSCSLGQDCSEPEGNDFIELKKSLNTISNITRSNSLLIYPNPTSDQFFIDANTTDKLTVDLYDVNGRHVFSASVNDKSKINVSTLNEGVYTLTIKTVDRIINIKLVIVR